MRKKFFFFVLICLTLILASALVYEKVFKIDYKAEISLCREEFGMDPYLILSVIKAESSFQKDAVSNKGAVGLMQILPSTAEELCEDLGEEYSYSKLFDPRFNIRLGTYYLKKLFMKFGEKELVLLAYNSGEGTLKKFLDSGKDVKEYPYKESREYVNKILLYEKIYKSFVKME